MPRDSEPADPKLIQEWLDKGNTVKVYPAFERTDPEEMQYKTKWGRPKKKKE